jgi:DNA-binding response OmpR family regulator
MAASKTILVVEDDPEFREGLTAVLGQHGYNTLAADDGREAQQLIDDRRPDLVILDMMMPRWGGLAVLEHFHGKAGAPPFIMMTANDGAMHQGYAEKLGVIDYLHKPFSMDLLLERVNRVVRPPAPPRQDATDSALRCRCPNCGSRIKAPLQLTGQTRNCPSCKRPFVVVFQPPEDEGLKLVLDEGPARGKPSRW